MNSDNDAPNSGDLGLFTAQHVERMVERLCFRLGVPIEYVRDPPKTDRSLSVASDSLRAAYSEHTSRHFDSHPKEQH